MEDLNQKIWESRFSQLNERSRWYSNQTWQIPFAYTALIGLAYDKVLEWENPNINGIGFILLSIFSLTILIHLIGVKYRERKAVNELKSLEPNHNFKVGKTEPILEFTNYVNIFLILNIFASTFMGVNYLSHEKSYTQIIWSIAHSFFIIIYFTNICVYQRPKTQ